MLSLPVMMSRFMYIVLAQEGKWQRSSAWPLWAVIRWLSWFRMSKTIMSKKYGVDLIRFTHNENTVICASKNQWDGTWLPLSLVPSIDIPPKASSCSSRDISFVLVFLSYLPFCGRKIRFDTCPCMTTITLDISEDTETGTTLIVSINTWRMPDQ